jgi:hypothetical protein
MKYISILLCFFVCNVKSETVNHFWQKNLNLNTIQIECGAPCSEDAWEIPTYFSEKVRDQHIRNNEEKLLKATAYVKFFTFIMKKYESNAKACSELIDKSGYNGLITRQCKNFYNDVNKVILNSFRTERDKPIINLAKNNQYMTTYNPFIDTEPCSSFLEIFPDRLKNFGQPHIKFASSRQHFEVNENIEQKITLTVNSVGESCNNIKTLIPTVFKLIKRLDKISYGTHFISKSSYLPSNKKPEQWNPKVFIKDLKICEHKKC